MSEPVRRAATYRDLPEAGRQTRSTILPTTVVQVKAIACLGLDSSKSFGSVLMLQIWYVRHILKVFGTQTTREPLRREILVDSLLLVFPATLDREHRTTRLESNPEAPTPISCYY